MDTHLTPALVSAPTFDRAGRPAIAKARATARLQTPTASTRAGAGDVFELARGEVIALHGRRGQILQVSAGRVWLTQSGDPDDHFVAAGEQLALRRNDRVVIEGDSEGPARVAWLG
jgi:quercetin dioxygenase-like cupin family protein